MIKEVFFRFSKRGKSNANCTINAEVHKRRIKYTLVRIEVSISLNEYRICKRATRAKVARNEERAHIIKDFAKVFFIAKVYNVDIKRKITKNQTKTIKPIYLT